MAISIPFIIIAQTCTAILQGIGKYMIPVINLIVGCAVKIIITLVLVPIPEFNVYGAVLGTIMGYITAAVLNLFQLKRILDIKINYYTLLIKPAYASLLMIIAVVFIYRYVYNYTVSNGIACLISVSVGALFYGALLLMLKVFEYAYVKKKFLRW